jgi:IS30 family transposase
MNGLVRQYIPKIRDLISVTKGELEQIMIKLIHRPRKCLDFKSPFEVKAIRLGIADDHLGLQLVAEGARNC